MSTYRRQRPATPEHVNADTPATAPPPVRVPSVPATTPAAPAPSSSPLSALTPADIVRARDLATIQRAGGELAPDDLVLVNKVRKRRAAERRSRLQTQNLAMRLIADSPAATNAAMFAARVAKTRNHDKRIATLNRLQIAQRAGQAQPGDAQRIASLIAATQRDARDQPRADAGLLAAAQRRCQLVNHQRTSTRPHTITQPMRATSKGAWLVYPRDLDPDDLGELAGWLMDGYRRRQAVVNSPMVDFEITISDMVEPDREWMRYVVRRVVRAMGRDPDRHALVGSHEPGVHPPSRKDGRPIQMHVHAVVLTCDVDGAVWRCDNLHMLVQRELEAINAQRGWTALTTSSVAKGKQIGWYTPAGSAQFGWSRCTTTGTVFTRCDDPSQARLVAAEPVPEHGERRPSAGIIVVNPQHSERREALRRADQRAYAAACTAVDELAQAVEIIDPTILADHVGAAVRLHYLGVPASTVPEDLYRALVDAIAQRDDAAIALITRRIWYIAHGG